MGDNFALPTDIAELTATYLTSALRRDGHLADGEVSSVVAAPLGAGVGFVGQLARLELTYDGDRGLLPDVMIAKFPIDDPMAKYLAQMFGFYRTEAECYRQAASIGLGVPTPAIYLSEVSDDDAGTLILMEDLGDARVGDQVAGDVGGRKDRQVGACVDVVDLDIVAVVEATSKRPNLVPGHDLGDDRRAQLEAMHLTRLGRADDVAHAAVYLASRESEFVTGTNLELDGGASNARGAVLG